MPKKLATSVDENVFTVNEPGIYAVDAVTYADWTASNSVMMSTPSLLDYTDQEIEEEYIKRFSPLAKAMKEEENE